MDLVTVVIPYFKKKEFIKQTLNSVLKQTYKNLEIFIIYDDENKEDLPFIKKLKSLDRRISLIVNKKSLGAGFSRNLAIKKSKGKFIGFLDADDLWDNRKIEHQLKFMKKKNFLITHTDYKIIDVNNKILSSRRARKFENIHQLLKSCDIGLSSVILQKKILNKDCLFPKLRTKEDFVLWLKILNKGIKIGSINKDLMYWRKTNNSLSSSIAQKLLDGFRVYNHYMKFNWFKSLYLLFYLSINFLKKK